MVWDKKQKYESFAAKLVSLPQYKKRDGKQAFATFRVENNKGFIWLVKCFGSEADRAQRDLVDLGVEVSIQGYKEEDSDSVFIANFLKLRGKEGNAERIARYYGSVSAYRKYEEEYREAQDKKGIVRTVNSEGVIIWLPKSQCIQFADGTWKQRIEFVMDVFGGANITAELLSFVARSPSGTPQINKENARRYQEWLEKKVLAACNTYGWSE